LVLAFFFSVVQNMRAVSYDIVIATHNEPIEWLGYLPEKRPYRLIVSCSGNVARTYEERQLPDEWITRENAGREAGHWLNWIVTRYDSLAEWTVFLQAEPFAHMGPNLHGPLGLLRILFGGAPNFSVPWAAVGMRPEERGGHCQFWMFKRKLEILEAGWGKDKVNTEVGQPFLIGAQFLVRRDLVLARPRDHYERILALAPSKEFSLAHELEPVWRLVFAEKPWDS
jgi:hypothetical protein